MSIPYSHASPFLSGLAIQFVGSFIQTRSIKKIVAERKDKSLEARLQRDGDIVQLICTYMAILPAALSFFNGKRDLLEFIGFGGFAVLIVSYVAIDTTPPHRYYKHRLWGFTWGTGLAVLLCAIGTVYALLAT